MENYQNKKHGIMVEPAIHMMQALLAPIKRRYRELYWARSPAWVAAELRHGADEHGMVPFNEAFSLLLQATDPSLTPNINRGMNAVHNLFRNLELRS